MSSNILSQYHREVNQTTPKNFVSPKRADEPTPAEQYELGRKLYFTGKRISECNTDDMCAGWMDAECTCAIAYARAMLAQEMN
jgi:hypothetical protein